MITHASIRSKAFNKKFNKLAQEKGWGLHNFVGQIHLDATDAGEVEMLTNMYRYIFGRETKGRLVIFDENDQPVAEYCSKDLEIKFISK